MMRKYKYLISLFVVAFFICAFVFINKASTATEKKECCNQPSPKTNKSNEHFIINSLNKFIVSL